MNLLTEQEIEDLYYTELDRYELSFARAIESAVIKKIKTQGAATFVRADEAVCRMRPVYFLPEGD